MAPLSNSSRGEGVKHPQIRFSIDRGGTFTDVFAEVTSHTATGRPTSTAVAKLYLLAAIQLTFDCIHDALCQMTCQ